MNTPAQISRIAIVGAGLMGHGIAQVFASQGCSVSMLDVSEQLLERAIENIRANLSLMADNGIGSVDQIDETIARIAVTLDLDEATADAWFIIEAVAENLELKREVFRKLDVICPADVILATNTSVISITEIAERAGNKERIVGTHFWNPPYLVPLVEVVRGKHTSPKTADAAYNLLKRVGKRPVQVMKDVPGFVGNRLQHALWREAISIVENGIADAATVDEVVKSGFGLRLPVLGPLENADLVGLDLTFQIHDYILRYLESSPEPSPVLKAKVGSGELGFKSGIGFQQWSEERIKKTREALLSHLLAIAR